MKKKKIKIHYPLLVASAYSGYVIWHMGYSSSAALFVASEGHSLVSRIGVIPVTETIFNSFNITVALLTLITITIICPLMRPSRDSEIIEIDTKLLKDKSKTKNINGINSFAQRIENNRYLSFLTGISLIGYIFLIYSEKGFFLDLNIVSWTFLSIGLLLANSPIHYVKLVNNAALTVGPIILQYPFYAGIMGIMADTGLIKILADGIASVATSETLGFFLFFQGD